MRTETEILADIEVAKAAYLEANDTLPAAKALPFSRKVKELQQELSDCISEGANPCPDCGQVPHGMRFHTHMDASLGIEIHGHEVGCLSCLNHRARAATAKEAVEKWNKGDWREKRPEVPEGAPYQEEGE